MKTILVLKSIINLRKSYFMKKFLKNELQKMHINRSCIFHEQKDMHIVLQLEAVMRGNSLMYKLIYIGACNVHIITSS